MKTSTIRLSLKKYGPFALAVFIIAGWAILFYFISPKTLVGDIGIQNSYIVVFVLGIICGFSSATSSTFYVAVAALSHGGAHPLVLGLSGGLGLCISDFAFYFVVSRGTQTIETEWKSVSDFIKKWMKKAPTIAVYPFVFVYSAFSPLPNDIILVVLAVAKTPFKNIAPFLFAGDIVSTIILAYISH